METYKTKEECDFEPKLNEFGNPSEHQCPCGAFVQNCRTCNRDKHIIPEESQRCYLGK